MNSATLTPTMTADEFIRNYGGSRGHELFRNQLVSLPMPGFDHNAIEGNVYTLLRNHGRLTKSGRANCGETLIKLSSNPDTIRAADVLFISYQRLPADQSPTGPLEVMPELVAEVRSPHDRRGAVEEKIREYLAAGVLAVMTVDPELESISIHRKNELDQRFHNGDTVTIPDILPGFAAPVKAFFE